MSVEPSVVPNIKEDADAGFEHVSEGIEEPVMRVNFLWSFSLDRG